MSTKKIKNEQNYRNICIFFLIIYLSFININSIQFFKSFNLLSNNNLVLITDEGIKKYDPSTQTEALVQSSDIIKSSSNLNLIAFTQFPLDEGGYVFCRLNKYIYVFDKTLDINYQSFIVSDIESYYCTLKPYKAVNGDIRIIITYVNNDLDIRLLMYR